MEEEATMNPPFPTAKKLKICRDQASQEDDDGELDRISELPVSLLHHILSFLDMEVVVKTSVLSRRWRNLWASLPILNFTLTDSSRLDFVDHVLLLRHNCKIQRLSLSCDPGYEITNRTFNLWILAATKQNLEELIVQIGVADGHRLPDCIFTCKTLTKLEVRTFCNWFRRLCLTTPRRIDLPMLKTLILKDVSINGDCLNDNFFSNCPNLEFLSITSGKHHFTNFSISSLSLKHLDLDCVGTGRSGSGYRKSGRASASLRLNTPNLVSFRCHDHMAKEYHLENLCALVKAEIDFDLSLGSDYEVDVSKLLTRLGELHGAQMLKFLEALHRVKELKLSASILEVISAAPALLVKKPIKFSNLRSLKLEVFLSIGCSIATSQFLKMSPNLETLLLKVTENSLHEIAKRKIELDSDSDSSSDSDLDSKSKDSACERKHSKFANIGKALGCISQLELLTNFLQNEELANKAIFFTSTNRTDNVGGIFGFCEKILTYPTASAQWNSSMCLNGV